ncbi:UNVERIFIED_ORG: pyruvate dehydrogenase E2 component (dihydrolipoamide acetyltransferase) [Xanthobacter viscosus]|uniref:Acetyltransferase component of pyruvate dehydrogenase complex n=1 Tax=Xanthobacter autotrophicus TaxID=280 RepID=A0A6C1KKY5_XANAU|nr:pyruvate dehydrogenase complex dihydrolipoamide acetyltransferase [Xanthobacter autotrophicus]TLX44972.1 pyruvate dehydrogenase complex dihydrolipoamide acetyltransferase [Xanthobacter autotrophicus]
MPIEILMPALSPTMEKGNLAKWLKKEGDTVKSGDVLAEIETDKATMEVESIDEGILAKILVPEGSQDVPVNQLIAVLAGEGEDVAAAAAGAGGAKPAAAAAPAAAAVAAAPAVEAAAAAAPAPAAAPAANGQGGRVFASPLARRIAKDKGIDLAALAGSGPHGRIVARDLEGAKPGAKPAATPAAAAAPAPATAPASKAAVASAPGAEQVKAMFEAGSYEEVQLDGMRKTIARRLVESEQVTPTFFLTVDCDLDDLMVLREQVNANAGKDKDGKPTYRVSVNDFIIKAMALALQKVPAANAVWAEDRVLRMKHSDVGVAVAIDGGLYAPIVKKAEQKTLSTISNEMRDLAGRARTKKLKPDEYSGGSTSVSNLGMMGIRNFTAIINAPQSSILAVGASEQRAVVRNGEIKAVMQMTVTMTCDHRVMDGALGAELLSAFKGFIEKPMSMLV